MGWEEVEGNGWAVETGRRLSARTGERRSGRVVVAAYGFGIFHSLIMAHPKKRKSSEKGWKVPGRSAGNDQRYVPNHILSSTPSEVQTRTRNERRRDANRNACTYKQTRARG